jgi:hypothetical protein
VIIFVEASMGLFLMEALRITHLFPRINNMPDKMRRRFMWVAFSLLLTLALVEVALAVLRDWIVVEGIKLTSELAGGETVAAAAEDSSMVNKIPTIGQMILGFILPWALAFMAIPLEYFIHSARTVLGVGLIVGIRGLAFGLRVVANIARQAGNLLVNLYDVLIFLPLLIERFMRSGAGHDAEPSKSRRVAPFAAK